ncbi:MAG TPA: response regulator transcription factor [Humibacillus xanthopallidus]|nr:response regulator transcription factor [Humibacillus xanthopallidus]
MTPDPVRVAVVARSRLEVDSLAEAIAADGTVEVVARATSPDDALALLEVARPAVVVADLSPDDEASLDFARSALAAQRDLGVVFVAEQGQRLATGDAIAMGVRGWVHSDDSLARLVSVITGVAAGELRLPSDVLRLALAPAPDVGRDDAHRLLDHLTRRQTDVLRCLVGGCSRAETAELLSISQHTVRTHVAAILRRLGVHSTLEAVVIARRGGLPGQSDETAAPPKSVDVLRP